MASLNKKRIYSVTEILVNIASLIEIPDINHGVIGTSDDLFTESGKKVRLRVDMNGGDLVFMALERAKELRVLLLLNHGFLLNAKVVIV